MDHFYLVNFAYNKILTYWKNNTIRKVDCKIIFKKNNIFIKWTKDINIMVAEQLNNMIQGSYKTVLNKLSILDRQSDEDKFYDEDKFSGVFMPVIRTENINAPYRIMLVGRETNGWNGQGGLSTILDAIKTGRLDEVLKNAKVRYEKQLDNSSKHNQGFWKLYNKLIKALNFNNSIIYTNLYAWDYNKGGIIRNKNIPESCKQKITDISLELFRKQIEIIKPSCIIFATGYSVDRLIKRILPIRNKKEIPFIPKKLWTFTTTVDDRDILCFRITHPAARGKSRRNGELDKNQDTMINELKKELAGMERIS